MNPAKVDRQRVKALTDLPNIGPAISADLRRLGIRAPGDLAGRDPFEMYETLCEITGARHDPCVIDVFMSATRFVAGDEPRPWWAYTAERKRRLAAPAGEIGATPLHPLLNLLTGGDRRSIGRVDEAVACVLDEPPLLAVLLSGMAGGDPLLRMRCADAAEKVTARHPEWLAPHKPLLLDTLARVEQKEVRWHVAPMLARLPLAPAERKRVVDVLIGYLNDPSSIVKTQAMQALADLAQRDAALRPFVLEHLRELVVIGTPAMKARGRKLLARFDKIKGR